MKTNIVSKRNRLLASVGTAVLAASFVTPAIAATVNVDRSGTALLVANKTLGNGEEQNQSGDILASIADVTASIAGSGTQTGSQNELTVNTVIANALSNVVTNDGNNALSLLSSLTNDGLASSASQVTTWAAEITAAVESNTFDITNIGFVSGAVTNSGNAAAANATVNKATTTINGEAPVGYTSTTTTGTVVLSADADGAAALGGTITASTYQLNESEDFQSYAANNSVVTSLTATAQNTVTGTVTTDENAINANTTGNSSATTIAIGAADASFAGTAVISNLQVTDVEDVQSDSASNSGSSITSSLRYDGVDPTITNVLAGSLSVDDNTVGASATANTSTNSLSLADAMAFDGTNASGTVNQVSQTGSQTVADLAVASVQYNYSEDSDDLAAVVSTSTVSAYVQELTGSSVTVSGNDVLATSSGNVVSSNIASGDGSALLSGSTAVAGLQRNSKFDLTATVSGSVISATFADNSYESDTGLYSDGVTDSSVSLIGNTQTAGAYGNQLTQSVALAATDLQIGTSDVTLTADANITATGGATVSSQQLNFSSDVNASVSGAQIYLSSNDAEGNDSNAFLVSENTQQALALGSTASNSLSLDGTTVGIGGGIVSQQYSRLSSEVTASVTSSAALSTSDDLGDWDSNSASSASLIDNLQRAIAYGGSVTNTLTVDANSVSLAASTGTVTTVNTTTVDTGGEIFNATEVPTVAGAYGILNDQTFLSDVTASAGADLSWSSTFEVYIGNDVINGSKVENDRNDVVAAAYANSASNSATLNIGSLTAAGDSNVAGILNVQTLGGLGDPALVTLGDVTAEVRQALGDVIFTDIEDMVEASSVSTSGNSLQALAYGNRAASNSLTVESTTIAAADSVTDFQGAYLSDPMASLLGEDTIGVLAGFGVQNAQASGSGTIKAQLLDSVGNDEANRILTAVGGSVVDSSVVSELNAQIATANANYAANRLELDANAITSTAAVSNTQISASDTQAFIGIAGSPAIPGVSVSGTVVEGIWTSTQTAASYGITVADLPAGYTINGGGFLVYNTGDAGQSGTLSRTIGGSPAIDDFGGVTITLANSVTDSSVAVTGNEAAGTAIGNNGTNSLIVTATGINGDGTQTSAQAGYVADALTSIEAGLDGLVALADYAVNSVQQTVDGSSSTATVYNTFEIDQITDSSITNSSIAVSDNSVAAEARANTVANSLTISATDLDGTAISGALNSAQDAAGALSSVAATADMTVRAPVVSSGSSLEMDGNTNSALSNINNAANTLSVSGTNVGSLTDNNALATSSSTYMAASADFALANSQSASAATLTATATTNIYNDNFDDTTTAGVLNGSVSVSGNATMAEATVNRAANALNLTGSANLGATGALTNRQTSSTAATASATSTVAVTVYGDAGAGNTLDNSTLALDGNSTAAMARGNVASNTLSAAAGATYPLLSGAASGVTDGNYASGAFAVLNDQSNSGAVTAQSSNTTYTVVLNGGTGGNIGASSVSLAGNSVTASAFGNAASNVLNLTALNSATPTAAVSNNQTNSGAITANVTNVTFGFTGTNGTIANSSLRNTANGVNATAVGNSAVNSIVGR